MVGFGGDEKRSTILWLNLSLLVGLCPWAVTFTEVLNLLLSLHRWDGRARRNWSWIIALPSGGWGSGKIVSLRDWTFVIKNGYFSKWFILPSPCKKLVNFFLGCSAWEPGDYKEVCGLPKDWAPNSSYSQASLHSDSSHSSKLSFKYSYQFWAPVASNPDKLMSAVFGCDSLCSPVFPTFKVAVRPCDLNFSDESKKHWFSVSSTFSWCKAGS